jgi:predicted acetyltransferase
MLSKQDGFNFIEPGKLVDHDLSLILLARYPGNPEKNHVPEYLFEMRHVGQTNRLGEIALRVGVLPGYIGHISYEVIPEHRGYHYAARALKLITSLAHAHGMKEIVITCLPDNMASRRTCERAGAVFMGLVDVPDEVMDEYHRAIDCKCRYILNV